MKKVLTVMCAVVLLAACATGPLPSMFYEPTKEELANADYGTYPSNYEDIARSFMSTRLKDPESARYRFTEQPRKAHTFARSRSEVRYIYRVEVTINAKNSYGGYVGEHQYMFDIRNGAVLDYLDMTAALQKHPL